MSDSKNLEDFLLLEMSRRNTDMVADLICQKHELFAALFQIYLSNEEPVSRRAAWVIDTVTENHPELIAPHLGKMIEMLPEFHHDGLKRHSLRMLARSPFPPGDDLGKMISICFDWLLSPSESVSVKVYSMEILYRISQVEPDMKKELADSIEWRMNEETAGFRNRGQKLLKKLYRELR